MAQKKNQNKQSGQLARQSQKQASSARLKNSTLGQPSMAAPVAYSSPTLNTRPKVTTSQKSSRIVHRELIATISGVTTFGSTSYAINPGLSASFPWLSTVAPSYEQYRFVKLRYHYVTRCATSYTGSVLLAPEYDALDTAPTTEVNMAMMAGAKEDVPWRDQVIDFNPTDMYALGPRKFIRTGALSGSADLKTYDAGQLFVGLASCADTSAVGKLWVEYDVELYIPQNPNAVQSVGIGSASVLTLTSANSLSTGVAEIVPFDTVIYDSIGGTNTSGSFLLPSGDYLVMSNITFDSSGATSFTGVAELRLDGAALSPVINSSSVNVLSSTGQANGLNLIGYVSSDGTNAISTWLTITAAGTLTALANRCQMSVQRIA